MYGISQNPDSKDYVLVFHDKCFEIYCEKCGKKYTTYRWCKPCQLNGLQISSGNEKIDDFIQEMQLKISHHYDIVFEWIPYNQFNNINEIDEGDFITIYSAEWKDGPLKYNIGKREYIRIKNKKVTLKCLDNSQDITNEFLNNEV